MTGYDDGRVSATLYSFPEASRCVRVKGPRRLVEDEQCRVPDQRSGEAELLEHPARITIDSFVDEGREL